MLPNNCMIPTMETNMRSYTITLTTSKHGNFGDEKAALINSLHGIISQIKNSDVSLKSPISLPPLRGKYRLASIAPSMTPKNV